MKVIIKSKQKEGFQILHVVQPFILEEIISMEELVKLMFNYRLNGEMQIELGFVSPKEVEWIIDFMKELKVNFELEE